MANVITKAPIDALADTLAEVVAETLGDTRADLKAEALDETVCATKRHTGKCKGWGTISWSS